MRIGVCLHGGAAVRAAARLHDTDRRAISLGRVAGAEIVVVEAVSQRGCAPTAVADALGCGAGGALRLVDQTLESSDAHGTGFALASAFDRLNVDLILFGTDADPEGLCDVPAAIAHHMSAVYLNGVVELKAFAPGPGPDGQSSGQDEAKPAQVEVTLGSGAWIRRLQMPLNAVIGIASDGSSVATPALRQSASPLLRGMVEVLALADLKLEPSLLIGKHDGRGAVVAAPRPLVTLHSGAAVAALLRR